VGNKKDALIGHERMVGYLIICLLFFFSCPLFLLPVRPFFVLFFNLTKNVCNLNHTFSLLENDHKLYLPPLKQAINHNKSMFSTKKK